MKTLIPSSFVLALLLILLQTYLLIQLTLFLLRQLKVLKRPYGGMDYAEMLPVATILMGVLIISTSSIPGIFQSARIFGENRHSISEALWVFFARSFMLQLLYTVLFTVFNSLNIRYMFKGHYQEPLLVVSFILSAIAVGMATGGWFCCREIIDNFTPKIVTFQ